MEGQNEHKKKKGRQIEDLMLIQKEDRRRLANVPDASKVRSNQDRRSAGSIDLTNNADMDEFVRSIKAGIRYSVDYEVTLYITPKVGFKRTIKARGIDISTTGILLSFENEDWKEIVEDAKKIYLKFEIIAGTMPEGYEMKVNIPAHLVRSVHDANTGKDLGGFVFDATLAQYSARRKDAVMLTSAMIMILFIYMVVMLMRAESIIYFKFNKWLYLYSIITATFLLSRYLFGALYRTVPVDPDYVPGVTILIPCFNEEEWIKKTIISCVNQDYPVDKLEIIVIDDCSSDHSVEVIKQTIEELKREGPQFAIDDRVSYLVQPTNLGKRDALCEGVKIAKHELVVFVDSDSFLDPFAVRYLVQPFKDKKMGGVAGRTDVANTYTNALTKMQSVRYYISFRAMKAAEAYFDVVTCLSGPLSCYRKQLIIDHMDEWLNQSFLGQKATFGDDRAMTNIVLRHHRTFYQDTAFCSTIVPNSHKVFLKQQMRWKRSWLRESLTAGTFMWRKEPWSAFFFYIGLIVPVAAPIVVLYNMVYVPITQRVFPTTFVAGLLLMSMLMSVVQLLLRRSSTWIYGMLFCIYYEFILLWQMPWAWLTFWKSTWGTRETAGDVKEIEKKRAIEAKDKEVLYKRAKKKLEKGKKLTEAELLLLENSVIDTKSKEGVAVAKTESAVKTAAVITATAPVIKTEVKTETKTISTTASKKATKTEKTDKGGVWAALTTGLSRRFKAKEESTVKVNKEINGMNELQNLMVDYAKTMAEMERSMAEMFAEHAKKMDEFSTKFEQLDLDIQKMLPESAFMQTPVVPVNVAPVVAEEPVLVSGFEPVSIPEEEPVLEKTETETETVAEETAEAISEAAEETEDAVATPVTEQVSEEVVIPQKKSKAKKEKKTGFFGKMFGKNKKNEVAEIAEDVAVEAVAGAAVAGAAGAAVAQDAVSDVAAEAVEVAAQAAVETVEAVAETVPEISEDEQKKIDEQILAENEAIVDRYEAMKKTDTNDSEDDYMDDEELEAETTVEETAEEISEEVTEEVVEEEQSYETVEEITSEDVEQPVEKTYAPLADAGLFAAPENDEYDSEEYSNPVSEATSDAEEATEEETAEEVAEETVEEVVEEVVEEEPEAEPEPVKPSYNPEVSRPRVEELIKDHEKEAIATDRLMDNMYKRHREELQRLCDELNVDSAAYDTYDANVSIPDDGEMFRLNDMVKAHINEKMTIEKLSDKMKNRHEREAKELCDEINLSYEDYLSGNY